MRRERRVRFAAFVVAGLALAAALAFFVSPQASGEPDGLNKVAIDEGFADSEKAHALDDAPTAGYAVRGVDDDGISTGLAGLIGVAATFAATRLLFLVVRLSSRRRDRVPGPPASSASVRPSVG